MAVEVRGVDNLEYVGRGGFATVYRGTQSAFRRVVAVKVLNVAELDDAAANRFERECQANGSLSHHPNIVSLYDSGITDAGHPYLVMDFLPGGSLADRVHDQGPIAAQAAIDLGMPLAGALETAHRDHIVHRDVKPENVLFTAFGSPVLADFGISSMAGAFETRSGSITTSVLFAAPEVFTGVRATPASDIYALAATLVAALRGTPAFYVADEENLYPLLQRVATEPVPDLRPLGVPDAVAAVLERAMAKQPGDRFATAEEFGRALSAAAHASGLVPATMALAPAAATGLGLAADLASGRAADPEAGPPVDTTTETTTDGTITETSTDGTPTETTTGTVTETSSGAEVTADAEVRAADRDPGPGAGAATDPDAPDGDLAPDVRSGEELDLTRPASGLGSRHRGFLVALAAAVVLVLLIGLTAARSRSDETVSGTSTTTTTGDPRNPTGPGTTSGSVPPDPGAVVTPGTDPVTGQPIGGNVDPATGGSSTGGQGGGATGGSSTGPGGDTGPSTGGEGTTDGGGGQTPQPDPGPTVTAPSAPQNVLVTAVVILSRRGGTGPEALQPQSLRTTLTWQPPVSGGGGTITGYVVRRTAMRGGSAGASVVFPPAVGTSTQVIGDYLDDDDAWYRYELAAVNAAGPGSYQVADISVPLVFNTAQWDATQVLRVAGLTVGYGAAQTVAGQTFTNEYVWTQSPRAGVVAVGGQRVDLWTWNTATCGQRCNLPAPGDPPRY